MTFLTSPLPSFRRERGRTAARAAYTLSCGSSSPYFSLPPRAQSPAQSSHDAKRQRRRPRGKRRRSEKRSRPLLTPLLPADPRSSFTKRATTHSHSWLHARFRSFAARTREGLGARGSCRIRVTRIREAMSWLRFAIVKCSRPSPKARSSCPRISPCKGNCAHPPDASDGHQPVEASALADPRGSPLSSACCRW